LGTSLGGHCRFTRRESDLRVALGRFSNFFSFRATPGFSVARPTCSAAVSSSVADATQSWNSEEHDHSLLDNLVVFPGLSEGPTSSSWVFAVVRSCSGLSEGWIGLSTQLQKTSVKIIAISLNVRHADEASVRNMQKPYGDTQGFVSTSMQSILLTSKDNQTTCKEKSYLPKDNNSRRRVWTLLHLYQSMVVAFHSVRHQKVQFS
jgi:hypothetical protein